MTAEANASIVVFPTDFSDASEAALPLVKRVADALGSTVHCISCVQNLMILSPTEGAAYPTLEDLRSEAAARMDEFAKEHLSDLNHPYKTAILSGRPADEIVAYADGLGADMIVMATHGHSGLAHILIGSTTENVVRHAKTPVLSIKAKG